MRRVLSSLLLSLAVIFPSNASVTEEVKGAIEKSILKHGFSKESLEGLRNFDKVPEDEQRELFLKAVDAGVGAQVQFLEKFLGRVDKKKDIPAAFRKNYMIVQVHGDPQETIFDISPGTPSREALKKFLASRKVPSAYYLKGYLHHCEFAAFLSLVSAIYADSGSLCWEPQESVQAYNHRIQELANEAVPVSQRIMTTILRPILVRQFDKWEECVTQDFQSLGITASFSPGFQKLFDETIDKSWYPLIAQFLIEKNKTIVEFGRALDTDCMMPTLIEKLTRATEQLEARVLRTIKITGNFTAGGRFNNIVVGGKEQTERRLAKNQEPPTLPSKSAAKGETVMMPIMVPKQPLNLSVLDLDVVKMVDVLANGCADTVDTKKDIKDLLGTTSVILRGLALAKHNLIRMVMGSKVDFEDFKVGTPFTTFITSDGSSKEVNYDPNSQQALEKDGLLLRAKEGELEEKLYELWDPETEGDMTGLLYVRDRALCDTFAIHLLLKLIPHLQNLKDDDAKTDLTHKESLSGYNKSFARFVKCYSQVFVYFLAEKGLTESANRLTGEYFTVGKLAVCLDSFPIESPRSASNQLVQTYLQKMGWILTALTSVDFPSVFNSMFELRAYLMPDNPQISCYFMPLPVVKEVVGRSRRQQAGLEESRKEVIQLREQVTQLQKKVAQLQEVNKQTMEKLDAASKLNKQNEQDLKKAQKSIEAAKKENAENKAKMKAELDRSLEKAQGIVDEENKKLRASFEEKIAKLEKLHLEQMEKAAELAKDQLASILALGAECNLYKAKIVDLVALVEGYKAQSEVVAKGTEAIGEWQKKYTELGDAHQASQTRLHEIETLSEQRQQSLEQLQQELELATKGNMSLMSTIESLEQQCAQLRREQVSSAELLRNEMAKAEKKFLELKKKSADELQEQKRHLEAGAAELLRKKVAETEKKFSESKKELEEQKQQLEGLNKGLTQEVAGLNQQIKKEQDVRQELEDEFSFNKQQLVIQHSGEVVLLEDQLEEAHKSNASLTDENARLKAEIEAMRKAAAVPPAAAPSTMDQEAVKKIVKLKKLVEERDMTIRNLILLQEMREEEHGVPVEVERLKAEVVELQARIKGYEEDPINTVTGVWSFKDEDREEPVLLNIRQIVQVTGIATEGGMLRNEGVMETLDRLK